MTASPQHACTRNDNSFSSLKGAARLAAWSFVLYGLCAAGGALSGIAASPGKMLEATPLVLKDGRIAEVTVHTIPFPGDAMAPSSDTRSALNTFTQSIATDCFLTAQVIGHVDKSEVSGRETADIHRLARARADTIQASLIENGLPPSSIASVWDWRFMVQQPRVTLWVFRLAAGDDCEDIPIGIESTDQVAEAPTTTNLAKQAAVSDVQQADASSAIQNRVIPAARSKSGAVDTPRSATVGEPSTAETAKSVNTAAAETDTGKDLKETQIAALSQDQTQHARPSASSQQTSAGAIEIVFDTNSSFFPQGAGDQLRAFLETLDENKNYVLRIQTSLDGDANVAGASSADEAQRYNTWIAERRFKRVEAWLLKNADGRSLTLEPSIIENDGSRRIRIEPQPLG